MEPIAKEVKVGYRFSRPMTPEDREKLMGDYLMKSWTFEDLGDRLAFQSPCKKWVHTYEVATMARWIIDWDHMSKVIVRERKRNEDESEGKDGSV